MESVLTISKVIFNQLVNKCGYEEELKTLRIENSNLIEEVRALTTAKNDDYVVIDSLTSDTHTHNHEQHIMVLEHQIENQTSTIERLQNNVEKYQHMFTHVTEHLERTERLFDEQKQVLEETKLRVSIKIYTVALYNAMSQPFFHTFQS